MDTLLDSRRLYQPYINSTQARAVTQWLLFQPVISMTFPDNPNPPNTLEARTLLPQLAHQDYDESHHNTRMDPDPAVSHDYPTIPSQISTPTGSVHRDATDPFPSDKTFAQGQQTLTQSAWMHQGVNPDLLAGGVQHVSIQNQPSAQDTQSQWMQPGLDANLMSIGVQQVPVSPQSTPSTGGLSMEFLTSRWQMPMDMVDPQLFQSSLSHHDQGSDAMQSPWQLHDRSQNLSVPTLQRSGSSQSTDQSGETHATSIDVHTEERKSSSTKDPHPDHQPFSEASGLAQQLQPPEPSHTTGSRRNRTRDRTMSRLSLTVAASTMGTGHNSSAHTNPLPDSSSHSPRAVSIASPTSSTRSSGPPSPKKTPVAPKTNQRQRNRVAASRCRQRTTQKAKLLEEEERTARARNEALRASASMLREEVLTLRDEVLRQAKDPGCTCTLLKGYLAKRAEVIVREDHEFGCAFAPAQRHNVDPGEEDAVGGEEDENDEGEQEDEGDFKKEAGRRKGSGSKKKDGAGLLNAEQRISQTGAWGTEAIPLVVDFSMGGAESVAPGAEGQHTTAEC